jgi:uncharacterized RDD family membrane protein YckC
MILHEVLTTEKVPFRYRVAGLGSRFLAWLIDAAAAALLVVAGAVFGSVLDLARGGVGTALVLLWVFAVNWCYFLLFEWLWHGQTPGKRLLGVRVIGMDGTAVSFYQSAVRNIVRFVDAPLVPGFYTLGFAVALCNRESRRLGDLAAGTLVVHVERRARPVQAVYDGASAAADRARVAALRQRLAPLDRAQKETVLDLCLRREQLRPVERARLFRAASAYFEARLAIAPGEHESDEKFVLQLGEALGG